MKQTNKNETAQNNNHVSGEGTQTSGPGAETDTGGNDTDTETGEGDTDGETVVSFPNRGKGGLSSFTATQSASLSNKAKLMASVKDKLAEAAKLDREAEKLGGGSQGAEGKATEAAIAAAKLLYDGRTTGALSADEANEMLGRAFGWKVKKNGDASKTPQRLGEAIRKRVVRAVAAYDYAINGADPIAFFEPLPREDVVPFLNELGAGKRSIWNVYNSLGEMKAERTGQRPKFAFDPRRISGLHKDMAANIKETVATIQSTPGLLQAYAGLLRVLTIIDAEMPAQTQSAA